MRFVCTLVSCLLLAACQQESIYQPQDLRQLSHNELIEKARNYLLPDFDALYRDQRGHILDRDSLLHIFETSMFFADTYVDDLGNIVEIVVPDSIKVDSITFNQLRQALKEGPSISQLKVDCNDLRNILTALEKSDQKGRTGNMAKAQRQDFQNLVTAISIIEQCGMPTLETVDRGHILALWLVFQHAPLNKYRKAYFHHFQLAAELGELQKSSVAYMYDRMLMMDKEPQIYGSQIRGSGPNGEYELWDIQDAAYVDQRRKEMGLGSLKKYVAQWGIEFDIPQKQK